jgi:hypothetical protein
MSRVRKIYQEEEYRHYYLVDSNFIANRFIPTALAPVGREKDRIAACHAW